jgi:hypothetical protein
MTGSQVRVLFAAPASGALSPNEFALALALGDDLSAVSILTNTRPARFPTWSIRRLIEIRLSGRDGDQTNNVAIAFGSAWEQGEIVSIPMKLFRKRPPLFLSRFPVLLLLCGCGAAGPECGSLDARNSVIKIVADDHNNSLVNYAVKNSSSVAEMVSNANAEAEKSAIREKARQGAIYTLDDTIVMNSRAARAVTCTGLLYVKVGDTTAQKAVEFKVEQMADGKTSVSVSPFLF